MPREPVAGLRAAAARAHGPVYARPPRLSLTLVNSGTALYQSACSCRSLRSARPAEVCQGFPRPYRTAVWRSEPGLVHVHLSVCRPVFLAQLSWWLEQCEFQEFRLDTWCPGRLVHPVQVDRVAVRCPRQRQPVPGDEVGHLAQLADGVGQAVVEDQRAGRAEVQELREKRRPEPVQPAPRPLVGRGPVLIVIAAVKTCVSGDEIW